MIEFIIDTSAYSMAQRGDQKIIALLNKAQQIYLPRIVEGELKAGFSFGKQKIENERLLEKFVASDSVTILTLSEKTPDHFAQIYANLRSRGKPIGQNDLWIAALSLEINVPLLTLDSDFGSVNGLVLVNSGT